MYQRKLLSESDGLYVPKVSVVNYSNETGITPQDDRFDDVIQIIEKTLKTNSGKDFVQKHQKDKQFKEMNKVTFADVLDITNFVERQEPKKETRPFEYAHRIIIREKMAKNLNKRPKEETGIENRLEHFKMEHDLDDILPHLKAIDKHFSCVKKIVKKKKPKIKYQQSYSDLIDKLCKPFPYPFRKFHLSQRASSSVSSGSTYKAKSVNFFDKCDNVPSETPIEDIDKEISVLSKLQSSTKQLHDLALKKSSASCRCENMILKSEKSLDRDVIKELTEKYKDGTSKFCYAVLLDYPRNEISEVESLQEIEKNIKSTMERIHKRFLNFSNVGKSSEKIVEEKTKKKKCKACTIF